MAVTIRDVAALAGVSPATVSRVLNADDRVAPELRERVGTAVAKLGYRPNSQARSLRTRATKVLGLIIADIQNPFFTALARGVEDAASERDYSVVLANSDESLDKELRYLEVAAAERMAGVILSPSSTGASRIETLTDRGIPVVTIDRRLRRAEVDSVTVNNQKAAKEAVDHLLAAGCRRIAMITGPADASTATSRLSGYRAALREADLEPDPALEVRGDYRVEGGRAAARTLLDLPERPDGLFVGNNLMMVGALDTLRRAGVDFPTDLLLAGFDEMSWAGFAPPITLVEQPSYDIGRRATELLLRRVNGEDFPTQRIVLPARLRIRESTHRPALA
ncbi:LacI family DNA-binding transcriptional regulator [Nocardia terpenica]|uniref:LacI family DNA-binding transcriptional regulator n=1 Tax=Nocardia terpenica TaxID=455432 RepID=UPI0018935A83|nr:LacI family DNA-binding transcriptional regulator [Nocardia terpenica]MBF6062230.1 LacI family DNA-binding transcriptional regulator [Nocardia terpenica]MBF6104318.1 LacI family DNA-binding transcriptional regulator [Nocardia terpenica]MBF6109826.1 LacI family DNA-binding transcriptional regulator [Nocardia terpenica]MBF6120132.1 LacI family DNA-binding transcriptional regulator [Nocardia terpenica]MBF6152543.1 LacI family DNA-binding transcriptional regulator [Nocardia terpenica]